MCLCKLWQGVCFSNSKYTPDHHKNNVQNYFMGRLCLLNAELRATMLGEREHERGFDLNGKVLARRQDGMLPFLGDAQIAHTYSKDIIRL